MSMSQQQCCCGKCIMRNDQERPLGEIKFSKFSGSAKEGN